MTAESTRFGFLHVAAAQVDPRLFIARDTAVIRGPSLIAPAKICEVMVPVALPGLNLEDMMSDIERLGFSVAVRYTDESCIFLHTDELRSECHHALVNVIEKNWLTKAKTRAEFFRVLKTAMCNRMRSLVQQYRFTQKRTGIKPPPKHERNLSFQSLKPTEISLDDPDAHLQVGEDAHGLHEDGMDTQELAREINSHLLPFDRMVFKELCEPSEETLFYATLDAYRGLTNPDRMKIRIDHASMAAGIGVDLAEFKKAVLRIQQVTLRLREMNPEDQNYEALVAKLSAALNVQVPKSIPAMVVRRMFTIAARDNWQKVTPEVEEALGTLGAIAPKFDKDSMRCHGVLYQRGHKICESCGLNVSCQAQAANVGLGAITIHPKLLGAKLLRTPYVVPGPATEPPPTTTERDEDIVNYLFRNFKRVTHQGELYFQPKDFTDKSKLIFNVGTTTIPLRLRFCKPNPLLKQRLVYVNKGYYASDDMSAEDVIALIDEHARFAYA